MSFVNCSLVVFYIKHNNKILDYSNFIALNRIEPIIRVFVNSIQKVLLYKNFAKLTINVLNIAP